MIDVKTLTDAELKAAANELAKRELERRRKEEEEAKKNTITVVCPQCGGQGRTRNYGFTVGVGISDEFSECFMCKGDRTIQARKV
jgi:DnaJ-class molecular chaperone